MRSEKGFTSRTVTALALLLLAAPAGATHQADDAAFDDGTYGGTYDPIGDDPSYDPAFDDPSYDDGYGPAYDDATYDDPTYDDATYDDLCDPAIHPDWASDPYCNPALFDESDDPGLGAPPDVLAMDDGRVGQLVADRSSGVDRPSLDEFEPDQVITVGSNRMLLAIDALAELGAFERSDLPQTGALVREVRDAIPADGLTATGYRDELERFAAELAPFLNSLEASGVAVSEELWNAADDLEDALAEGWIDDGAAVMSADPWIAGVGDLLRRGGQSGAAEERPADAEAIRAILDEFRALNPSGPEPVEASETTISELPPAPSGARRVPGPDDEQTSLFPVAAAATAIGALLLGLAVLLWRRRSATSVVSSTTPPTGSTSSGSDELTDTRHSRGLGAPEQAEPSRAAQAALATAVKTLMPTSSPSVADLLDASRRMTSSLDTATIATIALAEAQRLVDAEGGIIVRRSHLGLDPVSCEPPMLFNYEHVGEGCLPRVIETGRSIASIANDEPLLVEVPMAMAAVPIVADGLVSGAILVVRVSSQPFDRAELDSLEMLAPLVGSAFAAADTHETATEMMDVEPLTGLQNRRRLDLDLASISPDDQVAYVMVDIDHFKNFNDSNGHAAGDEALRQVSALLTASVRPKDLVYRYGGEEFCVLLPGATAEEAAIVAERARAAVEQAHIPGMENQPDGKVTISVGVSHSAWAVPSDLVETADAALYEAKRSGRNRVSLHQP